MAALSFVTHVIIVALLQPQPAVRVRLLFFALFSPLCDWPRPASFTRHYRHRDPPADAGPTTPFSHGREEAGLGHGLDRDAAAIRTTTPAT